MAKRGRQLEVPEGDLSALEAQEERIYGGFAEVADALLTIEEGDLFKAAGYRTFRDYYIERLNYQKTQAYGYVAAARVLKLLPEDQRHYFTAESQIRPVVGMKDPENQKKVLERAIKEAPIVHGRPVISAKLVEDVARRPPFNWKPARELKKKTTAEPVAQAKRGLNALKKVEVPPDEFCQLEGIDGIAELIKDRLAWLSRVGDILAHRAEEAGDG